MKRIIILLTIIALSGAQVHAAALQKIKKDDAGNNKRHKPGSTFKKTDSAIAKGPAQPRPPLPPPPPPPPLPPVNN